VQRGPYDREFFDIVSSTATAAARRIVPPIVRWLAPSTVVDVGCGEGAWVAEFIAAGCEGIGVDGPFVDANRLLIPADRFVVRDLERPLALGRRFDLALCLEVAEHLSPARADGLVDDLVALADRVLFSAATPGQGGYGHVNEQPHEYWVERFEDREYAATGVLRRRFAGDGEVASWYRANLLLFARVQPARQDAE
jgi:SAM-dependent methyltransferase